MFGAQAATQSLPSWQSHIRGFVINGIAESVIIGADLAKGAVRGVIWPCASGAGMHP